MLDHYICLLDGNIAKIWNYLFVERTFLPVEGKHFERGEVAYTPSTGDSFNGIKFKRRLLLPLPGLRDWKPGK